MPQRHAKTIPMPSDPNMTPAQSGLLHTWSRLHTRMKRSVKRLLASDVRTAPNLQDVPLVFFYRQMWDRGSLIADALKVKFSTSYDDRLPLVVRGNVLLMRLAVSTMLDYAMDRHQGVGYMSFEVNLTEGDDWDYVNFTVRYAGSHTDRDTGIRTWFSRDGMERLVADMGGRFLVEDRPGMEVRYAVRIPLIPGDPSTVSQIPLSALTARLTRAQKGITALVVDDSPISRVLGASLLARHNISADVAENGQTALEKLTDRRYDLIFMDYAMPELDGIQTVAAIRAREQTPGAFIIGMNPDADSAATLEAVFLETGMQGCLVKPVDPLQLNLLLLELLPQVPGQTDEAPEYTAAPDPADNARQDLVRTLSPVAGLDAEKGLANSGRSVEIYAGMLRRFTLELEEYIEPLLTLSGEGAWQEIAIRLHVLWGFFISIGAEELAREAAALAEVSDAGGGRECVVPRIQRHCDAMMSLRATLVGLKAGQRREAPVERREQETTPAPGPAAFRRKVSRLHDACLSYRATEAQATADSLRKMSLPEDMGEHMARICALVDTLDYDEARERCARLLEMIGREQE